MELSLAVNTALMALGQFAIFCMEPFRIPLAGKLDICCFDKTGTLTSENLDVEGIAGVHGNDPERIVTEGSDCPREALLVSSTCHSLFLVRQTVAGDPMERVALEFAHARLVNNDQVKGRDDSVLRIVHRFPFSSALKRMSCVVQADKAYFVSAKGAPETMRTMFTSLPAWYDRTFLSLAHDGARVLALGHRSLSHKGSVETIRALPRSQVESKLDFVGFLVFRCPLKKDSKAAVNLLKESGHRVCIITGDNALTAIYTARELELVTKPVALVSAPAGEIAVEVVDRMQSQKLDPSILDSVKQERTAALLDQYDVCMLGEAVDALNVSNSSLLSRLLPHTAIFARASPNQKELILTSLKSAGWHTLMCGDGTNDVGALKQAHVGVALLDGRPEDLTKILREMREQAIKRQRKAIEDAQRKWKERLEGGGDRTSEGKSLLDTISGQVAANDQESATRVRLGDASVAAPFTSKVSSIHAGTALLFHLDSLQHHPPRPLHACHDDPNVQDTCPQLAHLRLQPLRLASKGHPLRRLPGHHHRHASCRLLPVFVQRTAGKANGPPTAAVEHLQCISLDKRSVPILAAHRNAYPRPFRCYPLLHLPCRGKPGKDGRADQV